jgi:transcriptional regulator with GAF, ATPase, and Fis domain
MSDGSTDSARRGNTLVYTDMDSGALRVRRWRIRIIAGPDAGQEHALDRGSLLVGSGTGNDLVLTDPRISRAHVELRLRESGLQVRDLGSTNGTFIGNVRVGDTLLQAADVVRLGSTQIAMEPADRDVDVDTSSNRLGALLGQNAAMRRLFGIVQQVAPSEVPVLLEGETGTGKEEIAEQLHEHSARREGPFVVVDCGALAAGVVESELFGHVRGAFTGAVASREGAFEMAHGGTIFLDEIGDLPGELQPKLLRALERGQVRRVGDNEVRSVDVRVISATCRDLTQGISAGSFRADLFYRLAVVRLRVPPLRERLDDLPLLVPELARRIGGREFVVPKVTLERLGAHSWPGNVRELRNTIAHAIAVRPGNEVLEITEIARLDRGSPADQVAELPTDYRQAKTEAMARFEVQYLEGLLERHSWNVSAAAREAGVDRNYLHRLIKRHGLKRR